MGALLLASLLMIGSATAQVTPGPGLTVLRQEVLAADLFHLYAAETGPLLLSGDRRIWLGGWRSLDDVPRDRIVMGRVREGELRGDLELVLERPDALVNDPAVVRVPGRRALRMYFTSLALDDLGRATERNVVWTARSRDGGRTWDRVTEAIGQSNGVNACGAWSPSVLVEDGLLCVYYHGNSPCLGAYRTCFEADGTTVARPTEALSLPFGLANVDVARLDDRYVMVGNLLGLPTFSEIRGVESPDGRTWVPLRGTEDGVLVRAEAGVVLTPHVSWLGPRALTLLFTTRSSLLTLLEDNVLHRWTLRVGAE
jgi:hypothetical protein